MSSLAIQQEIEAEDVDEAPGALWTRALLERTRVRRLPENIVRVAVGVDPPGGATECGIVASCLDDQGDVFVMEDASGLGSPAMWSGRAIDVYERLGADRLLGEVNFGGDMVEATIRGAAKDRGVEVTYLDARASRGKAIRAEPIVAQFERGTAHLVGRHPRLEEELVGWIPGQGKSPNRLDAMVWSVAGLTTGVLPRWASV